MNDATFERKAAEILRASAADVDAATQARLQRARQVALAARPQHRSPLFGGRVRTVGPAFVVAAAVVLAVALWPGTGPDRMGGVTGTPAIQAVAPDLSPSDVDFLMTDTNTNMEMIEDLEFFSWLDADRSDDELRAEMEAVNPTGA